MKKLIYKTALFAYVNTICFRNVKPTCTKISEQFNRNIIYDSEINPYVSHDKLQRLLCSEEGWQKYGGEAQNNFQKAMEADSLNPRPEYLIGAGVFYTPKQFGGGPDKAKPILENSFRKYEQFVPANDLMPTWGKQMVEELLKQINETKQ